MSGQTAKKLNQLSAKRKQMLNGFVVETAKILSARYNIKEYSHCNN